MSIPVSEIQKLMSKLAVKATIGYASASAYAQGVQHAYDDAIKMLEELIPSEASNTGNSTKPE